LPSPLRWLLLRCDAKARRQPSQERVSQASTHKRGSGYVSRSLLRPALFVYLVCPGINNSSSESGTRRQETAKTGGRFPFAGGGHRGECYGGDRVTEATLHPNPLMKYTDVPRSIEMATLWIWQEDGRPVALGKVEAYDRKESSKWLYCFASASTGLVKGKWPDGHRFQAKKPGVEWVNDPGAGFS
jgi:hypothetical protein